ncbi:DUF5801 repeats-in-toxin domain-containing protein, partial [Silicimonas sp. MF1-12-2]|uniref:DUF5801 repeats-in-toxin domain-containing protein n=1 Tax=Silicimonas sp. MF1-12-2 TaxID=3384793 RepID=UPI0039B6A185
FSLTSSGLGDLPDLFSGGEAVVYDLDTTNNILYGYIERGDPGADSNDAGYDTVASAETGLSDTLVLKFELSGDNNATWTYTQYQVLDHIDQASPASEENLALIDGKDGSGVVQGSVNYIDFSTVIRATDFDGDYVDLAADTVYVEVIDDKPEEANDSTTGVVEEEDAGLSSAGNEDTLDGAGAGGIDGELDDDTLPGAGGLDITTNAATGDLDDIVDFGADGPAAGGGYALAWAGDGSENVAASTWLANLDGGDPFYSGGVAIDTATVSGNTLKAYAGTTEVFELSINPTTGVWTFTLKAALDHDLVQGENILTLNLGGAMTATDFDGDTIPLSDDAIVVTAID